MTLVGRVVQGGRAVRGLRIDVDALVQQFGDRFHIPLPGSGEEFLIAVVGERQTGDKQEKGGSKDVAKHVSARMGRALCCTSPHSKWDYFSTTSTFGFAMMKPFTGRSGVNEMTSAQLWSVILMCPGPIEPWPSVASRPSHWPFT